MTWYKVDDGIHSHPKFLDVSLAAVGLWTMCGAWCSAYLTDGQITRRQVQRDPLLGERLARQSAAHQHIVREWQRLGLLASDAAPVWCRRSVFWHRGHPLQVMESFAPWVTALLTTR